MEQVSVSSGAQRLGAREAEALWRAWSVKKDSRARDRLVVSYSPMVRYLATKKLRELPSHWELDDLVSCGLLALVEAIDRFDPAKGATFEQYAWTRVSGSIVDELRRQDWVSRSTRRFGRKIDQTREAWYTANGTEPSELELSEKLQVDVEELRERLAELSRADLLSLQSPARGSDEGTTIQIGDTIEAPAGIDEPERAVLNSERARIVREAVASLSEREREILVLIVSGELQGAEIAPMFGVSESRISQILAGVRRKLQAALADYDTPVAA
jgi:RNA polymerase sigma factor for flagellar operon FliA